MSQRPILGLLRWSRAESELHSSRRKTPTIRSRRLAIRRAEDRLHSMPSCFAAERRCRPALPTFALQTCCKMHEWPRHVSAEAAFSGRRCGLCSRLVWLAGWREGLWQAWWILRSAPYPLMPAALSHHGSAAQWRLGALLTSSSECSERPLARTATNVPEPLWFCPGVLSGLTYCCSGGTRGW